MVCCVSLSDLVSKIRRHPWYELCLLPEALILLAVMRLMVLLVPFQRIASLLGLSPAPLLKPLVSPSQQLKVADSVGWAIRAMASRTPWESACLTQALAGMVMLQRRKIPALLFLGVAKSSAGPEKTAAHAWLTCGDAIITGGGDHEKYVVISSFCG